MGEIRWLRDARTAPEHGPAATTTWDPRLAPLPKGPVIAPAERVLWGCQQIVSVLADIWPECLDQWTDEDRWRIQRAVRGIEAAAHKLARLLSQ